MAITLGLAIMLSGCPESTILVHDGGSIACSTDRDCSPAGLVCDLGRGVCVECVGPADCTAEEICLAGDCSTRIDCTSSRMCSGLVCDPARGYCVQCVTAADCEPSEMCADGSCVPLPPPECVLDADCGVGMRCASGRCEGIPPDCVLDADCGVGMRCVSGMCEPDLCTTATECGDGVYCNGVERCAPGAPGAGPRGCAPGTMPCAATTCDEASDACTSCDADFDGHRAPGCGGDDCDDADVGVHPGVPEPCDGIDSNCSAGGGMTVEEDADGDGFATDDGTCSGGPLPATDCDDTDGAVRPTAVETCNAADDDCDGLADDPPAGTECLSGEVCFRGACTATPSGGITAITAGASHACALHASGMVYCWGTATEDQLGDGGGPRPMAGPPVTGLNDAIAIDAGANHTCALRRGGSLVCWGYASFGQIGDGTMVASRPTPRAVIDLAGPVSAVAGAALTTCALLTTGEAQCWGESRHGQVGDGSIGLGVYRLTPSYVLGLSAVSAISGGYMSACALRADRTVACWGANSFAELGDGTTTDRSTPVEAFPGALLADQIAAGIYHTCARHGSSVSCWGRLSGTGTVSMTRVGVPGVSDAAEIDAGADFDCVRRTSGTVSCWGTSASGELGTGAIGTSTSSPAVPVVGLADAIQLAISGAGSFACALRATGAVVCWGDNTYGQLGDGTMTDRAMPVTVLGLPP